MTRQMKLIGLLQAQLELSGLLAASFVEAKLVLARIL